MGMGAREREERETARKRGEVNFQKEKWQPTIEYRYKMTTESNSPEKKNIDGVAKNKPQSKLRWLILILTCLMLAGNYYAADNPSALKTQIGDFMGIFI